MKPLDKILDLASKLPLAQRKKLLKELESLDRRNKKRVNSKARSVDNPYAYTVKLAASMSADFSDLSTDKYRHVAAAAVDDYHAK